MIKEEILVFGMNRYSRPTGICKYTSSFLELLINDERNDISLVVGSWQVNYYKEKLNLNSKINLIALNIPNNSISRNIWFLFFLPLFVMKFNPNKIIFTYPIPFIKLFLRKRIKLFSIIHDLYPFTNSKNFKYPFFNKIFTTISICNSDKLIVVSQHTLEEVTKAFPKRYNDIILQYIPMRFNLGLFESPMKKPYFLCVAQHSKNKNIDWVIDIYVKFNSSQKFNYDLVIIGANGSETKFLKQMVEHYKINNQVHFLSNLNFETLIGYYQNCEMFLLLSSNEGLGIPLVEALFYSKCIICSNIPVFNEIDQENVNFVKINDKSIDLLTLKMLDNLKPNLKRFKIDKRFDFNHSISMLKL